MQTGFVAISAFVLCLGANVLAVPCSTSQSVSNEQPSPLSSIFNITDMPGYVNNTGNITTGPQGACYAAYAAQTYQISVVGGAELRFCAQAGLQNLSQFFAVNDAVDFKAELKTNINQCKGLLPCQTQVVSAAVNKVRPLLLAQSPDTSACVEEELAKITAQLNTASDQLQICLTMAAL